MGGKSKSSTSTSTTVTDNRIAADGGSIVATNGSVIEFLSDEALHNALIFAENAGGASLDLVGEVVSKAFDSFLTNQTRTFDTVLSSQDKGFEATQTALEAQRSEGYKSFKEFLVAAVAVAAITGAVIAMKGKFK